MIKVGIIALSAGLIVGFVCGFRFCAWSLARLLKDDRRLKEALMKKIDERKRR